jgi:hypothetical protein
LQKGHQRLTPPSYAIPSHYRFSKLFRKEAPDGRGRTFVPDNASIRIRLITRRPLLHTQRSSTPRRMALLDTGGRTPGCVLDFSASFHINHNKYLCDFVSQLTIKLTGAPFFSASG